MLAFFFSGERFLETTFLATFFFVRELGFFALIAVATLFQTAPGAAVTGAAAVAAAWANSPTKVLVPSAAVFPAATTVPFALAALSRTAAGTAVAAEAALAAPPARALAFDGTFSCGYNSFLRTRYDALTRHIPLSRPEDTQKHRTRDNRSLEEVRGLCWFDSNVRFGSPAPGPFSASAKQCLLCAESDRILRHSEMTPRANRRHCRIDLK
jgi:hypothetical protein